jgi:hypothetical protein
MVYTVDLLGDANLRVRDLTITRNTYLANVVVDASADLQSVTTSGSTTTNSVEITSAQSSTSKLTGALKVTGGVGVQGNVYVGSNVFVDSNLEVGTANLFVNTTDGRVGVGSTLPNKKMHVYTATGEGNTQLLLQSADRYASMHMKDDTGGVILQNDQGSLRVITGYDANDAGGSQKFRVDSDGDVTLTSNIEIGGGGLELTQVSNVAQITSSSNVVTEYTRSKKLIKYPRVYMTAATTSGYTASASSEYSGRVAWEQFDSNPIGSSWETADGTFDSSGDDVSGTTFTVNGASYTGHWAKLQLPERVVFHEMFMNAYKNDAGTDDRRPKKGVVLGSNDNSTWELIHRFDDDMAWSNTITNQSHTRIVFLNHPQTAYEYVLFLVEEKYGSTTRIAIYNMEFYGIPQYDPEAHGTDVIMRSVPNVPNTDWLEVYYDANDYTSMPATITDKSGNGVTGTPNNGVTFDSTWKAFTFDGVNDYIRGTISGVSGDYIHSASLWIKLAGTNDGIFEISGATRASNSVIGLYVDADGTLAYYFYDNDARYNTNLQVGQWYHVGLTYHGGGERRVYVNGVQASYLRSYGTLTNSLTLAGGTLTIGSRIDLAGNYFNGSMANFRFFNRALTADEIWQLYAYQKDYFQASPDAVTFKGGRLGIATKEPQAVLDVRGDIHGGCPVYFQSTCSTNFAAAMYNNGSGGALIEFDTLYEHKGDCFDVGTSLFTAPIHGLYKFGYSMRSRTDSTQHMWTYIQKNGSPLNGTSNTPGRVYIDQGEFAMVHNNFILELRAGDTIGILLAKNSSSAGEISNSYNSFHGRYIGRADNLGDISY